MRIFIPATLADLGADEVPARRAHAFTPALGQALAESDPEAGEYHALLAAAADALALLRETGTGAGALVRVVVAADVDSAPPVGSEPAPSAVLAPPVSWSAVVSFHVDDPTDLEAQQVLRRAVGAPAQEEQAVAEVAGLDLLWFDATERAELLNW